MLRSQGVMSLIGVLQHLECATSKRQPFIKKLFQRYFVGEFTTRHKFACINEVSLQTDVNALLRSIAVTYPSEITWRNDRSYMLGEVSKVDKAAKEL